MPGEKTRHGIFRALTWLQWVSTVVYVVSALIPVGMFAAYGVSAQTYISIVLGTTIIIVFDRISRYYFENITEQKLNRLYRQLDIGSLNCIGGISRGLDWITDNLGNATRVLNTVFTRSDVELAAGQHDKLVFLEASVRAALSRGCDWTDLYTSSETETIDSFKRSLNLVQLKHYRAIAVRSDLPMFQYMVVYHRNDDASVIFGWGFKGGSGQNARAFTSTEEKTVAFFADHFRALRSAVTLSPERLMGTSQPTARLPTPEL